MTEYLENLLKEWFVHKEFDEEPKHPKWNAEELKSFVSAYLEDAVAYCLGYLKHVNVEPLPTAENVKKEVTYLFSEDEMPRRPPLCPKCSKCLLEFYEDTGMPQFTYDVEKGMYEPETAQTGGTFHCRKCDSPIGGWSSSGEHWGLVPGDGLPEVDE